MRNRYRICEDTKPQRLPVSVSSKIKKRIVDIYKHNQNNSTALTQWSEYIEGLKSYISNPVIAFDYTNRYAHFPNGAIHLVDMNYDISFITKSNDANEYVYVYIFDINFKLGDFGLKDPNIIENKQYNTMKKAKRIRLTEGMLHRMIKEAINELDWKTYNNAAQKRLSQKKYDKFQDLRNASEKAFNRDFGYNDEWDADLQHGGHRKVNLHGTGDNYSIPTVSADKHDTYPSLYGAYKTVGSTLNHSKNGDYVSGGHHESCNDGQWSSHNADDFDFGSDAVFRNAYERAKRELDAYNNGDYQYEPNGRGWHLKDGLDESIHRAIRRVLR